MKYTIHNELIPNKQNKLNNKSNQNQYVVLNDVMNEDVILIDENSNNMELFNIAMVRESDEDDLTDDETELSSTDDDYDNDDSDTTGCELLVNDIYLSDGNLNRINKNGDKLRDKRIPNDLLTITYKQTAQNSKRSASKNSHDDCDIISKKTKLSSNNHRPNNSNLAALASFSKFMKSRSFGHKLTRDDLEEFCLQKITEALMQRTDESEQNRRIKKMEQTIDSLRKEIIQLRRRTKNLEIVILNFMCGTEANGEINIPQKLTRSVGIQFRHKCNCNTAGGSVKQIIDNKNEKVTPAPVKYKQNETINNATSVVSPENIQLLKTKNLGVTDLTNDSNRLSCTIAPNNNLLTITQESSNEPANQEVSQDETSLINQESATVQSNDNTSTTSEINLLYQTLENKIEASTLNRHTSGTPINSDKNSTEMNTPALHPLSIKSVHHFPYLKHPAPLPALHIILNPKLKHSLPKPILTIEKINCGILFKWEMPYDLEKYERIMSYELYAYKEVSAVPNTDMWRKVGDIEALPLPMACTIINDEKRQKYYFALRSVDIYERKGAFSDPKGIFL